MNLLEMKEKKLNVHLINLKLLIHMYYLLIRIILKKIILIIINNLVIVLFNNGIKEVTHTVIDSNSPKSVSHDLKEGQSLIFGKEGTLTIKVITDKVISLLVSLNIILQSTLSKKLN